MCYRYLGIWHFGSPDDRWFSPHYKCEDRVIMCLKVRKENPIYSHETSHSLNIQSFMNNYLNTDPTKRSSPSSLLKHNLQPDTAAKNDIGA